MTDHQYWDEDTLEEMVSVRAKILGRTVWAAARPDSGPVISFAGGLPDISSLPGEQLLHAGRAVIDREQREALQYGGTHGPQPLREEVAKRSSEIEGIEVGVDQVLITSGSAHAIGVVCEALVDPGDVVLAESPTFSGSLRTMRTFGAELRGVPMDEHGIQVDLLEEELKKLADEGKRPKFVYSIPNHQNPAGITLPLGRRERFVELAEEYHTFILEDDAYGELWFDHAPPPSLFSLSKGDHGIKVSTFSKIIATGLRMGWTMAAPAVTARMAAVRYDMGSSPFQGRLIAEMIRNGDLERHVANLRGIYKRKFERIQAALSRYCSDYCSYQKPDGGFFLWLKLRADLDSKDVQRVAAEKGVIVAAGAGFFVGDSRESRVRLAFSYVQSEDIEEGIERLGEAMAEVAAASGSPK